MVADNSEAEEKASEETVPVVKVTGRCLDMITDIALRRTESAAEDKRELDNKASIFLAANGVLLGFIATAWGNMEAITGALSLITIVCSTIFCLFALKTRNYSDWKIEGVWTIYQKFGDDIDGLKKQIIADLKEADETHVKNIDDIVKNYKMGLFTFGVSIVLAALSLILRLLPPIEEWFPGLLAL